MDSRCVCGFNSHDSVIKIHILLFVISVYSLLRYLFKSPGFFKEVIYFLIIEFWKGCHFSFIVNLFERARQIETWERGREHKDKTNVIFLVEFKCYQKLVPSYLYVSYMCALQRTIIHFEFIFYITGVWLEGHSFPFVYLIFLGQVIENIMIH